MAAKIGATSFLHTPIFGPLWLCHSSSSPIIPGVGLPTMTASRESPETIVHPLLRWEKTISFSFQMGNEPREGPPAHTHPRILWGDPSVTSEPNFLC